MPYLLPILLLLLGSAAFAQPQTPNEPEEEDHPEEESIAVVVEVPDSLRAEPDSTQVIDVHPQDSPADRGFLIITSDGKASLRIRGSIRVNGGYNINGLLAQDTFSAVDIPVGNDNTGETSFFMQAEQSRLGVDVTRQTRFGESFIRVELDFRGVSGGARLRHAYGVLGPLLAGRTWSTFSDVAAIPLTVDLDGPSSSVAERTVQIRYTRNPSPRTRVALSLESPTPEISAPDSLSLSPAFQSFPDVAGWGRTHGDWGHAQLSGILRSITVRNVNGGLDVLAGYGVLASGEVKTGEVDRLLFQIVGGEGISRHIGAFAGRGLDVIFNPGTEEFETVATWGGYVSYHHGWNRHLASYLTVGRLDILNRGFESDDAFGRSDYVSANLFWEAAAGTRLGLEYTGGWRTDKGGADGNANRISFIVYYDF